jgi:hypothetical protein
MCHDQIDGVGRARASGTFVTRRMEHRATSIVYTLSLISTIHTTTPQTTRRGQDTVKKHHHGAGGNLLLRVKPIGDLFQAFGIRIASVKTMPSQKVRNETPFF